MNRIMIVLAGVFLLVLAVVLARTLMLPAPPAESAATAPAPAGIDAMTVARHLADAVRFRTISYGNGVKEAEKNTQLEALRAWLEKTYPDFHKAAAREIVGESLLFTWKGRSPSLPPILLMAHMDVVPVVPGSERDWSHPPFSGDIADGYVWGRGSIDDKGSLILLLEAANRLAASGFTPARTIMFACGQDEEVGGAKGNGTIAKLLGARGVHFAWVLDEGGTIMDEPFPGLHRPVAFVSVAEKGYLSVELVAHGQGGHSSRPSADMAIVHLANAVLDVVQRPFTSGLDDIQREKLGVLAPLMSFPQRILLANLWLTAPLVAREMATVPEGAARLHTTIAPTILAAGIKDNVIPSEARATINFRLHPRDTIASAVEHVRRAIDDDPRVTVEILRETQAEASRIADIHGAAFRFLTDQIQGSFGHIPVAPEMSTGATDSRHYLPIADDVFRLDPFHFGPEDLARVHGTNERLAIADIAPAVAFYMRLMQNLK